jgi:hypothetical protein
MTESIAGCDPNIPAGSIRLVNEARVLILRELHEVGGVSVKDEPPPNQGLG